MSQQKWIVRLAVLAAATAACSQEAPANERMTVQGTVAQQLYASDVQAVAIGQDGRSFWSALDSKGDFKLLVPVGQSYRVLLAKVGPQGQNVALAQLTLKGTAGKAKWIAARSATTLRLGGLVPAGTIASPSTPAKPGGSTVLGTASRGSGRGGTEEDSSGRGGSGRGGGGDDASDDGEHDDYDDDQAHSDDPPCEEKDKDSSAVCSAPETTEMECTRNDAGDVSESTDWSSHAEDSSSSCSTPNTEPPSATTPPSSPPSADGTGSVTVK